MLRFDSGPTRKLIAFGAAVALAVGVAGTSSAASSAASARPQANGGVGSLEIDPADQSGLYLDDIEGVYFGVDTPASLWTFVFQGAGTWGTGTGAVSGYSYELKTDGQCLLDTSDQSSPVLGTCGANGTSWVFVDVGNGYEIYDRYGLNQRPEFQDLLGDVSFPSSDQDEVIIFNPADLVAQGGTGPFSITWQPSASLGF